MRSALRSPNASRRAVAAAALAAAVLGTSVGLAGTLPLGSTTAGAGGATVTACDPDGFTYAFTTVHGDVTAVTVGDLADPGCEGGTIAVTVTDAGGAAIASAGPATVPSDGDTTPNSVTLSTAPQPAASLVAGVHTSVSGP